MNASLNSTFAIISLFSLPYVVAGQEPEKTAPWPAPDEKLRSYLELPNQEGVVTYDWQQGGNGPEIVSIIYSGPPEWLSQQKHPQSHWHKLPSLRKIELNKADTLTPKEMKYIASLKSVTELVIDETLFNKGALAPLENMTWLKSFYLNCNDQLSRLSSMVHDLAPYERPHGDCFKFLEKLTSLETLKLWPDCDDPTFVRVCKLKNLKDLQLGKFTKLEDKSAELISNLKKLESISLQPLKNPKPILKGLREHPNLTQLWIDEANLATADVEDLATLKKLNTLYVKGERIGSLSSLAANTELVRLNLHFAKHEASEGYKFLKSLPNLEQLFLLGYGKGSVPLENFSLEHLRGHKKLKGLGVAAVLSDGDIAILESMPELKSLGVDNPANSVWRKQAKRRLPGVEIGE
jgi:hypothetical protein